MDLAILGGLLATFTSLAGLLFAVYTVRSMNKKLGTFEGLAGSVGQLLRYKESEEGEPLLDARLVKMIGVGAGAVAKSLKMSLLGGLSGQARLEKGLKGAIAQDVVDNKMPIINLAGDLFGFNTKKYIGKHPEALAQILQMARPLLGNLNLGGVVGSSPASRGNDGVGYGT